MRNSEKRILLRSVEDSTREHLFIKPRISIGRDLSCDLSFSDNPSISRLHAEIFLSKGVWYIVDRGSRNGTWVNQERLEANKEYPLSSEDRIDFAHKAIFIFIEDREEEENIASPAAQRSARFCPICGSSASGRFCYCCGHCMDKEAPVRPKPSIPSAPSPAPVQRALQSGKICPSCGTMVEGRFCRYCGQRMYDEVQYSSAPAYQAAYSMPQPSAAREPAEYQPATPKKKGLFSKIGAIFGEKADKAPAPASPRPVVDDVQFRGTAPETIRPGEYFLVKIMMYREDDYQRADRESAAVADRTKSTSSSVFQATQGQQFRIALQSPDIELDCETQQLRWNGKFAAADFEVYLPETYDRRQLRLRGRVYSDNAVLTDLKLILQIGAEQPQNITCEKVRLHSAFISYASADRAKVVARIQGIQLARPDMELFFDVESLRRGERWESRLYQEISGRDLFYLFWSSNAANSEWVQKELRYALEQKTADYIEPIPLEDPQVCPPPQSLVDKHFNDWTLRYLNNQ